MNRRELTKGAGSREAGDFRQREHQAKELRIDP